MTTHKDLTVWKKSMNLVLLIYKITKSFPKEELYGLVSQMRGGRLFPYHLILRTDMPEVRIRS